MCHRNNLDAKILLTCKQCEYIHHHKHATFLAGLASVLQSLSTQPTQLSAKLVGTWQYMWPYQQAELA